MSHDFIDDVVAEGVKKVEEKALITETQPESEKVESKPEYIDPELVKQQLRALEIMGKNRAERRRISKLNHGIRIPGVNRPVVNLEQ